MKFFIDTANINDIKELNKTGFIDGVTTNPSLFLKTKLNFREVIKEICYFTNKPVSVEVISMNYKQIMIESDKLRKIAPNICIKLPLTFDGLQACQTLIKDGTKTNITLCFNENQALLAAKAGATYVSPFIGRLDDFNTDGIKLIKNIRTIYDNYKFKTKILVASIRSTNHIKEVSLIGADIATIPAPIIKSLVTHALTNQGLLDFKKDWILTGQKI